MLTGIVTAAAAVFLAAYAYFVLPFSFFDSREPARGGTGGNLPRPVWKRVLAALKEARPRLDVGGQELRHLKRRFAEPERPYVSWRGSLGYYDLHAGADAAPAGPCLVFRSRLMLLLLPLRLILDRPLCWLFNRLNMVAYVAVLGTAFLRLRLSAWRHRARLAALDEAEKGRLTAEFDEYLQAFAPDCGQLSVFAEPGYFFFKLAEGRLFRQALRRFGPRGPCLDIGPDDGAVSVLHLAPVLFIDFGLNTSNYAMVPQARWKYGAIKTGFIEDDVFAAGSFADVYLIHVVDHIPDLDGAMAHLARLLKPGGRLYFSGLSHDFKGWWLESLCAAGAVWNNRNLSWHRELCARHGLETVFAAYCQAPPANAVWKATYGFAMKTAAWRQLARWLEARPERRQRWRTFLRDMWLSAHLLDEPLAEASGRGLNFMMVVQKPSDSA